MMMMMMMLFKDTYLYTSTSLEHGLSVGYSVLGAWSSAPLHPIRRCTVSRQVWAYLLHSRSNCVVCAIKTSNRLSLSSYLFLEIRFKPAIPNK